MNLKLGQRGKITTQENRVFVVCGFTKGSRVIPDGWLIDENGSAINPRYCEPYKGATSVFEYSK